MSHLYWHRGFIVTSVFDLPSNWKKLFVVVAMVHPASYWCFATGNLSFILSAILVGAWYKFAFVNAVLGAALFIIYIFERSDECRKYKLIITSWLISVSRTAEGNQAF